MSNKWRVIAGLLVAVILVFGAGSVWAQVTETQVWVDDDYTTATSGWGVTHFDKIQDGVNGVADNGTVHVAAGVYTEWQDNGYGKSAGIIIDKPLHLQGSGDDCVIRGKTGTTWYMSYGCPILWVKADDVEIDNFKFDGATYTEAEPKGLRSLGILSSWSDWPTDYAATNLNVHDNTFVYIGQAVTQDRAGGGNITIVNNTIVRETRSIWYDPRGATPGSYVDKTLGGGGFKFDYVAGGTIRGNIGIETPGVSIFLHGCTDITVEGHLISALDKASPSDSGLHIQGSPNTQIQGNTISDYMNGPVSGYNHGKKGAGVIIYSGSDGTQVTENVINGNSVGVFVCSTAPNNAAVHFNSITGNEDYGVFNYGSYPSGSWNYWDYGDYGEAPYDVDATLNWWDSVDGPTHASNPTGDGDAVSGHVIYSPWLGIDPDGNPATPGVQIAGPMTIIVAPVGPAPAGGYLNTAIAGANSTDLPYTDTVYVKHGTYTATTPITGGVNIISEPGSAAHTTLTGDMTLGSSYVMLGRRGQGFTVLGSITIPVGTDASTIQANWNNLLGALTNKGTGAVDATLNYWGDPNGPSAGDAVGAVAYSPWLGLAADDSPMLFVVAPVGSEPAGGYLNTAIAAANDLPGTDTIEVKHGTYTATTPITDGVNIISELGSASHTTLNGNMSVNGNGVLIGLPLQGFRVNGNLTVGAGANAATSRINWCDFYGLMTNNGTGTFDAQYNYWGTLLASVVDGRTTGDIDYDPFLPKNADDSYVDATAIMAAGLAAGIDPAIDQLWLMVQLGQDVNTFIQYQGVAGAGAFGGAAAGGQINLGGAAGGGGAVEGAISGTYTPGEPIDGRFTITDPVTGEPIIDAAVTTSLLGPDGGLVFWGCATYDETTGEYVFTIDTSGLAPGTYELIIQTDDGQSQTVSIEVLAA
jgi:hypothetical protein